ncbi:acyltransferase family protein [Dyadobacter frigoris]|nr:heparan-alpha-glucosaminide N-acetyltransferase domain-containing protein [Dyadobacter frigoris]GLU54067.1 membrane protein [Dyadobacter frigoris]
MKTRLISLDVLRGLTIILMTIVNNPGDWGHVYSPLLHAEWHGCTPTDLVFPTFLFIVGVSVVLATPQKILNANSFQKIITRTIRIFCLGMFLYFFSKIHAFGLEGLLLLGFRLILTAIIVVALFSDYDKKLQFYLALAVFVIMMILAFGGFKDYETVRIPGVLQRIAIVYFIVSILYLKTNWKTQAIFGVTVLLTYWALMTLIPVPGVGEPNFEKGTNLAAWLDNYLLPGHLWITSKTWDPEGILSTLPAIGTGIAGLLVGTLLTNSFSKDKKALYLFIGAISGIVIGLIWNTVFPINKALWTSSYVLYAAGIASLCLVILYYVIDVLGISGWTKFFVIFGVNPMVVFFFSGIIPRVLSGIKVAYPNDPAHEPIGLQVYFYEFKLSPLFSDPINASLAYALTYLTLWFVILYILYRNKLVFKV